MGTNLLVQGRGRTEDSRSSEGSSTTDSFASGQEEWIANALKIRPEAKESVVEEPSDEPESIRPDDAKEPSMEARRRTSPNEERNSIIVSCLERGDTRAVICRILDERVLPTTPQMKKHKIHRWTEAWDDLDFRKNVQQIFSRTLKRHGPVKSES